VKLVPTFADRGCHVVSMTDPYGRILGFLVDKILIIKFTSFPFDVKLRMNATKLHVLYTFS
jgi:hypothetical protein